MRGGGTRVALAGGLTMAAALGVDRFVYTPLLPLMQQSAGLSTSQAGLIASANFVGYLVGALLSSVAGLPGSRRAWLILSLATSAGATLAMGWSTSLPAFAAVRFVGGAAGAMAIVIATAMTVETSVATGRSALLALHFAGVGTGIVASAALVALLSAEGASWREGWLFAGVLSSSCVFCVLLLSTRLSDSRGAERSSTKSDVHPSFISLAISNGLSAFGYVTVATFLVVMVRRIPSASHLDGWVWIVFGLATGPSILFWNTVVRATSLPTALVLAYLTEAVGVAASLAESSTVGMLIAAICVGATFMANTSLGMLAARKLWPGDLRRPVGVMTAFFGVGQIVGPAVSGYLSDLTGSFVLPSVIAFFGLLVGALLLTRIRKELLAD